MKDNKERIKYQIGGEHNGNPPTDPSFVNDSGESNSPLNNTVTEDDNTLFTNATIYPKITMQPHSLYPDDGSPELEYDEFGLVKLKGQKSNVYEGDLAPKRSFSDIKKLSYEQEDTADPLSEYEERGVKTRWGIDNERALAMAKYQQSNGWYDSLIKAPVNIGVGALFGLHENAAQIGEILPDWMRSMYDPVVKTDYWLGLGLTRDIEYDYDSDLIHGINSAKQWLKGITGDQGEIYTRPKEEGEGMFSNIGSWQSWMNTISLLGESIAGFGAAGSAIGKSFMNMSKISAAIANATPKAQRALNYGAQVVTSGALSYVEGAMTGAVVFRELYDELRNKGYSDEEALNKAQRGASAAAQLNTLINTVLNFGSINHIFRGSRSSLNTLDDAVASKMDDLLKNGSKTAMSSGDNIARKQYDELSKLTAQQAGAKYGLKEVTKDTVKESLKEGLEGGVNVLAEQAGLRYGRDVSNADSSYIGNISSDINEYLKKFSYLNIKDAATEEGIHSFLLEMIGGAGQNVLMENLALGKSPKRALDEQTIVADKEDKKDTDSTTEVEDKTIEAGTIIKDEKGNSILERKSARKLEDERRQIAFNRAKVALLHDLKHIADTQDEILKVSNSSLSEGEKTTKIEELSDKLFSVESLRAIRNGTLNNLRASYEFIMNLDNKNLLSTELQQRIVELEKRKSESKSQDEIKGYEISIEKLKQLAKNPSVTDAMARGFSTKIGDDSYKEKAKEALAKIDRYEQIEKMLNNRFNYGDDESLMHISKLYNLKVSTDIARSNIAKQEKAIEQNKMQVTKIKRFSDANLQTVSDKIDEMQELSTQIEAKVQAHRESMEELNDLMSSGDSKAVINKLKDLFPTTFNEAVSKKMSMDELSKVLFEEFSKYIEEARNTLQSDIDLLMDKRKVIGKSVEELTGYVDVSQYANDALDALKLRVKAETESSAKNLDNALIEQYKNIELSKLQIKAYDDAFNHLASSKGRKAFITSSNKYFTNLFKKLKEQETRDKEKIVKKDTAVLNTQSGATGTDNTTSTSNASNTGNNYTVDSEEYARLYYIDLQGESDPTKILELVENKTKEYSNKLTLLAGNNKKYRYTLRGLLQVLREHNMGDHRYHAMSNMLEHLMKEHGGEVTVMLDANDYADQVPAKYSDGEIQIRTKYSLSFGSTIVSLMHELVHHKLKTSAKGVYSALSNYNKELASELMNAHNDLIKPEDLLDDESTLNAIIKVLERLKNNSQGLDSRKYDSVLKAYKYTLERYRINGHLEEIVTQGLTDQDVAWFLNTIEYKGVDNGVASNNKSFWNRLVDVLLALIGIVPNGKTYYTQMVRIIDEFAQLEQSSYPIEQGTIIINAVDVSDKIEVGVGLVNQDEIDIAINNAESLLGLHYKDGDIISNYLPIADYRYELAVDLLNKLAFAVDDKMEKLANDVFTDIMMLLDEDNKQTLKNKMSFNQRNSVEKLRDNYMRILTSNKPQTVTGKQEGMKASVILDEVKKVLLDTSLDVSTKTQKLNDLVIANTDKLDNSQEVIELAIGLSNEMTETIKIDSETELTVTKVLLSKIDEDLDKIDTTKDFKEYDKQRNTIIDKTKKTITGRRVPGAFIETYKAVTNHLAYDNEKRKGIGHETYQILGFYSKDGNVSINFFDHPYRDYLGGIYTMQGEDSENSNNVILINQLVEDNHPLRKVSVEKDYVYRAKEDRSFGDLEENLYYPQFVHNMFVHKADKFKIEDEIRQYLAVLEDALFDQNGELALIDINESIIVNIGNRFTKEAYSSVMTVWKQFYLLYTNDSGKITNEQKKKAFVRFKETVQKVLDGSAGYKSPIKTTMQDVLNRNLRNYKLVYDNKTRKKKLYAKLVRKNIINKDTIDFDSFDKLSFADFIKYFGRIVLTKKLGVDKNRIVNAEFTEGAQTDEKLKSRVLFANASKRETDEFIAIHTWLDVDPIVELAEIDKTDNFDDDDDFAYSIVGHMNNPEKYHLVDNVNKTHKKYTPSDMYQEYVNADDTEKPLILERFASLWKFNDDVKDGKTIEELLIEAAKEFEIAEASYNQLVLLFQDKGENDTIVNMFDTAYSLDITSGSYNFNKDNNTFVSLLKSEEFALYRDEQNKPVFGLLTVSKDGVMTAKEIYQDGKTGEVILLEDLVGDDQDAKTHILKQIGAKSADEITEKDVDNTIENKSAIKVPKQYYAIIRDLAGNLRLIETLPANLDDNTAEAYIKESRDKGAIKNLMNILNTLKDNETVSSEQFASIAKLLAQDESLSKMFFKSAPFAGQTCKSEWVMNYNLKDPDLRMSKESPLSLKVYVSRNKKVDNSLTTILNFTIDEINNPYKIIEKIKALGLIPSNSIKFNQFDIKQMTVGVRSYEPFNGVTLRIKGSESMINSTTITDGLDDNVEIVEETAPLSEEELLQNLTPEQELEIVEPIEPVTIDENEVKESESSVEAEIEFKDSYVNGNELRADLVKYLISKNVESSKIDDMLLHVLLTDDYDGFFAELEIFVYLSDHDYDIIMNDEQKVKLKEILDQIIKGEEQMAPFVKVRPSITAKGLKDAIKTQCK